MATTGFRVAAIRQPQPVLKRSRNRGNRVAPIVVETNPAAQCNQCGGCLGCESGSGFGIIGSFGLDSFKGVSDDVSNFGAVTSLNTGVLIPGAEDFGLGWQTGISYGVYDFDGRAEYNRITADTQQQTFVTTGFYRKAKCGQRLSFGLVYDWMFNSGWGYFGTNPTMGQWRGQIEYALNESNGIGVWGTKNDLGAVEPPLPNNNATVTNRAISQVNLFWHHKFVCTGADSWLWLGIPDHKRLDQSDPVVGGGSLGDWTIGASLQVPLSERLALYTNGSYMHPSCVAGSNGMYGATAAHEATYDVSMGIAWYFGCHARSSALQGKCFMPYMPVANNSNFLVDQNFQSP